MKLKGVIIFPALFDEQLHKVKGVSSDYQIMIDRLEGCGGLRHHNRVLRELRRHAPRKHRGRNTAPLQGAHRPHLRAKAVAEMARSEKETNRRFDNRY